MMKNLEKEKLFFEISESYENKADIKLVGNQSLQIMLPCGCKQTQNFYCGRPKLPPEHSAYNENQSRRFNFFEFCKIHE